MRALAFPLVILAKSGLVLFYLRFQLARPSCSMREDALAAVACSVPVGKLRFSLSACSSLGEL